MTFLIVSIIDIKLKTKSVRIDLNSQISTIDVKQILKDNDIQFFKILKWNYYRVDYSIHRG